MKYIKLVSLLTTIIFVVIFATGCINNPQEDINDKAYIYFKQDELEEGVTGMAQGRYSEIFEKSKEDLVLYEELLMPDEAYDFYTDGKGFRYAYWKGTNVLKSVLNKNISSTDIYHANPVVGLSEEELWPIANEVLASMVNPDRYEIREAIHLNDGKAEWEFTYSKQFGDYRTNDCVTVLLIPDGRFYAVYTYDIGFYDDLDVSKIDDEVFLKELDTLVRKDYPTNKYKIENQTIIKGFHDFFMAYFISVEIYSDPPVSKGEYYHVPIE